MFFGTCTQLMISFKENDTFVICLSQKNLFICNECGRQYFFSEFPCDGIRYSLLAWPFHFYTSGADEKWRYVKPITSLLLYLSFELNQTLLALKTYLNIDSNQEICVLFPTECIRWHLKSMQFYLNTSLNTEIFLEFRSVVEMFSIDLN